MSVQASVVLATARTFLNDDIAANWPDTALFPKLAQAHKELQIKLRRAAAPVMKKTYIENVTATTLVFATPPADLVAPITLWEKLAADPVTLYAQMTETDPLPNITQAATMIYWAWVNEAVAFIGSSAARTVKMLYWRSLAIPTVNTDLIGIIEGELYLAPRTAALAEGATGQAEAFATLTEMANNSLAEVIMSNRGRAPSSNTPSTKP